MKSNCQSTKEYHQRCQDFMRNYYTTSWKTAIMLASSEDQQLKIYLVMIIIVVHLHTWELCVSASQILCVSLETSVRCPTSLFCSFQRE